MATGRLTEVRGSKTGVPTGRLLEVIGQTNAAKGRLIEVVGTFAAGKGRLFEAKGLRVAYGSAPVVDAGDDFQVYPGDVGYFNPSETTNGGTITTRTWRQVSKSDPAAPDLEMYGLTIQQPPFVAPNTWLDVDYVFGYKVTDSNGFTSVESFVTVHLAGSDVGVATDTGWDPVGVLVAFTGGWK